MLYTIHNHTAPHDLETATHLGSRSQYAQAQSWKSTARSRLFPGGFNGREPSLDVAGAATIAITQEVNLFASLRLIEWRLMKNTGSEPDNRTTARRRH